MSLELITPSHAVGTPPGGTLPTPARLRQAKRAYTVRHVPEMAATQLISRPETAPRAGDLVLARVQRVGKHTALEGMQGRRSTLFVGDEIVVAYGARYAPDQFDAEVPADLGPCHLAAGGGVAARVVARHGGVSAPTELQPLGLLADAAGRRLNLADFCNADHAGAPSLAMRAPTIASLGTSMNAGKTTSAAYLVRGLVRAGLRVGAAKVTGTGSGNDPGLLRDAGAALVLDFTDFGHASTAGLELGALLSVLDRVQAAMAQAGMQALVMEVADGLLQRETAMLLRAPRFADRVDACLFSSGEAMGAVAGVHWLQQQALPVLALAGAMTRSPLARAEAEAATGLSALGLAELGDPGTALRLLREAVALRSTRRRAGVAA